MKALEATKPLSLRRVSELLIQNCSINRDFNDQSPPTNSFEVSPILIVAQFTSSGTRS